MRSALILLLTGIAAGLLAWSMPDLDTDAWTLQATEQLQHRLDNAGADLEQRVVHLANSVQGKSSDSLWTLLLPASEDLWDRLGVELLVFKDGRLEIWTGRAPVSETGLINDTTRHVNLRDGSYLHAFARRGPYLIHGFRQVWSLPPIENRYLRAHPHPSLHVPADLMARFGPGIGPVLRDMHGQVICRTSMADPPSGLDGSGMLRILFALLGSALVVFSAWRMAQALFIHGGRATGLLAFAGVVLLARWPTLVFGFLPDQGRWSLFDPGLFATSAWSPSLGDLFINVLLFALFARLVHHACSGVSVRGPSGRTFWSLMGPAALLALAAWINAMIKSLVVDGRIELDLYHIQSFDRYSLLALICISLLLASWGFLADAWARAIGAARDRRQWITTLLLVAGISVILHFMLGRSDIALVLWPIPLIILARLHGSQRYGLWQAVLMVTVLGAITAHILTTSIRDREDRERQVVAERLLTQEDPVVELLFREVSPALRHDAGLYALLADTATCTAADLDRVVRQEHFTGYWERYDVRLYAYGTDGLLHCATDPEPPHTTTGPMSPGFALPPADMPDLQIEKGAGLRTFYHARLAVMANDTAPPAQLVVELHPRLVPEGLGFPELLLSGQDPLSGRLDRYDRARYEDGILVEQHGHTLFPVHWDGKMTARRPTRTRLLSYGDLHGPLLVLAVPRPGWKDRATTFSYLFTFFSIVLAIGTLMAALLRKRGPPPLTISAKVRLALVSFSAIGLLFFGSGAQRLLSRSNNDRSTEELLDRIRSVHADLQRTLEGLGELGGETNPYLDHVLGRLSNIFFSDIHVFRKDGRLLSSSRPQLFDVGLIGRRMDPRAFVALSMNAASAYVQQESIGTALHRAAYMPLRDHDGNLMGYLALPSFADQAQQESERADVLVAVVNLFVLLFALSVIVAVIISNWTTGPLDLLKRSLARVALTGANVPIRYRGQDEVGQLVEVYNRKVEELRASADKLARSERESAWREMARQVAHEIKNPLTPMKLSIQHFQRTWRPDLSDAQERLVRFGDGLVQQIDLLSSIAGEFSNFAQMPPAHEARLDLCEVAHAALSLYAGQPDARLTLVAPEAVFISADRDHLLRVFNNLIKNALQAMSGGREPEVIVHIRKEANEAIAEVIDNGSGIPPELQARVFEPSFTTRSTGMGLGLAMVKRLVENAGGRVWFETHPGQGTRFFVALPLSI
ncbi:MAG: GHKL domain-containing protein [Flavobacteriales bacterium]|nr:GHKL domain-containing protein [Flavobacteriales bacterium]MCB9167103.1 GHKL domain-containing protein [Flavobacteriales bacterium]